MAHNLHLHRRLDKTGNDMVLNWFRKTNIKKRYIALGLITLELASLPAAAKIIGRITESDKATASVVLVDSIDGRKRFAVATTAPFYVSVTDATGDISVNIHKSGRIGEVQFGDSAQMPGVALTCSYLTGEQHVIYQSERQTALRGGDILSQAVVVAIHFDKNLSPNFKIDVGTPDSPKARTSDCFAKLA